MGAKHILVVEDEEVIRETLRFNLVREGYQVSQAANGIEALPFRITTVYGVGYRLDRIVAEADVTTPDMAVIGRP